jgi:hypothetical protein
LFPNAAKGRGAYAYANSRKAYGHANRGKAHGYTNRGSGWNAYGYVNGGQASGGTFINGNFIPRGTSPAQVPDHVYDEN